ncbi:MAG: caspase family protein [Acidobacteria bacterium]|nr:caspase family protein [Acidobacteriota bacterium]
MQKNIFLILWILTFCALSLAQPPQLIVPTGHVRGLGTLEISPDGKYLFTKGEDGKALIWDVRTGAQLRNLDDGKAVTTLAFSYDGKKYAVGYWGQKEGNIKVFDMATARLLYATTQLGNPKNMTFTKDDKYLLTAGGDYRMTVFEAATGKLIKRFGTPPASDATRLMADEAAEFIVTSPDGRVVAIGTGRKTVEMFDISSANLQTGGDGKAGFAMGPFAQKAIMGKWSPDGKIFLFATQDGTMFCFSAAESKGLWQSKTLPVNSHSAVFSADGRRFTMVQNDTLHEVDTLTGQLLSNTANKLNGNNTWWAAMPARGMYLKQIGENSLALVDWNKKAVIAEYRQKVDNGWTISMATDTPTLVNYGRGAPQLWDLTAGRMRRIGLTEKDKFLVMDPKGQKVAYPNGILDLKTNATNKIFSLPGFGTVWSQDWSRDGRYIVLGGYYTFPGEKYGVENLFLYEAATGKQILNKKISKEMTAHSSAFSPDNRTLAVGLEKGRIELYELPSGNNSKTLKLPFSKEFDGAFSDVYALTYSADGSMMYASVGKDVRAINAANGKVSEANFSNQSQEVWGLSLSPDNKYLLSSGTKGLIHLYDVQTARLMQTYTGHVANIMEVRWFADGKHFISASDDHTLRIWEKDSPREQVQLFGFSGSDDWVAVTPDGRFDGTPGGMANLYFVKGLDVIPLESLYDKYYTPGLLKRIMAGEKLPPISEKDDIRNLKLPPIVKILPPVDTNIRNLEVADDAVSLRRYVSKTGRIKLTVEGASSEDGISELRLFHNGKAIGADTRNLSVEDDKIEKKKTLTFEVQLSEGENQFRAIALNSQRTESRPDEIVVANTLAKPTTTAGTGTTLHLVVVGINQYKNPKYNLNYATADATAFKDAVERNSAGLYARVNAVFIGDAQATKAGITAELEKIKSQAQPGDVFIFYYAGHGVMNENKQFYIVPHDVTQLYGADEALAQRGLSSAQMQQFSKEIKAQKQLFILDACQSAGALDNVALRGAAEEKAIAQLARATGTHWLTASGSEQFAAEFKQLGHGTFTYVLLEALSGKADKAGDRKITVKELDAYLQEVVPELSAKYKGTPQYPASYGFGNDFPIGIVK